MNTSKRRVALASVFSLALLAAACGDDDDATSATEAPAASTTAAEAPAASTTAAEAPSADLSGTIAVDGSSTVTPLMTLAAEDFQLANSGVQVTVGTSGTGGGFEKFCAGETDISNGITADQGRREGSL